MLFKIESKMPLTNCKNESLNQIIGGIVKLAGQFYLTDVGEVNYLYSTLIEQSKGNQKQIEKLEKAKEKKLSEVRTNGSSVLPTRYYSYFRDNPTYMTAFNNANNNEGVTY